MAPCVLAFLTLVLAPVAAGAETCLVNRTAAPLFLAVDTGTARATGWRDSGERLCVGEGAGLRATVSAFPREDALEGCSRRVASGTTVAMLEYQSVDLCRWAE